MNENKSAAMALPNRAWEFLRMTHPETKMILFCIALFLASAWFLSWKIGHGSRSEGDQDSFALAFESRDQRSLEFFIENHARDQTFTYKIRRGKNTEKAGAKFVRGGAQERIILPPREPGGRISVIVEDESGQKQEIYRQP